jgi:hypothetical protein
MSHAVVVHVDSVETIYPDGVPFQRASVSIAWTSDANAYASSSIDFDQVGGCDGSGCIANSAVEHLEPGDTWLLFIAADPATSTPLALGKSGMFRVVTSAEEPENLESGTFVFAGTSHVLEDTSAGIGVVPLAEAPAEGSSAIDVASAFVSSCNSLSE